MTIPGPADLPGALTTGATGVHALEAAAEFIIGYGCWLHRDDFTSRFVTAGPDSSDPGTMLAASTGKPRSLRSTPANCLAAAGNAAPCA
jgi:hypothetical protein